jgi:hypothetical protein
MQAAVVGDIIMRPVVQLEQVVAVEGVQVSKGQGQRHLVLPIPEAAAAVAVA